MTIRNRKTVGFLAVAAALLLGACANQMEPAQKAIAGVESAVNAAAPDAAKYVPDQLATVQKKLADLKGSFDNKDYAAVLTGAPAVLTEAQGLLGTAMLKKDEVVKALSAQWPALAASLPGLVSSVTSHVAAMAKSKHAPAGVDVAAAQAAVADAGSLWSKAQAAFAAGNVEEAVNTANEVKAKAEAAAAAIKMKLPNAAPAAAAAK
jgi:hypothetical protein